MSGENPKPEKIIGDSDWSVLSDFQGEKNLNSATGKPRTFTEFDSYPIQKGETPEEYGARLRRNHELTEKYEKAEAAKTAITDETGKRTEIYLNSDFGKQELAAEEEFQRMTDKIDNRFKNNPEHAQALKDREWQKLEEKINSIRQGYEDNKVAAEQDYEASGVVASDDDVEAFERWRAKQDKLAEATLNRADQAPADPSQVNADPANPIDNPDKADDGAKPQELDPVAAGILAESSGMRTKEFLDSEFGKKEVEIEKRFEEASKAFNTLLGSGFIAAEDVAAAQEKVFDKFTKEIDENRLAYANRDKAHDQAVASDDNPAGNNGDVEPKPSDTDTGVDKLDAPKTQDKDADKDKTPDSKDQEITPEIDSAAMKASAENADDDELLRRAAELEQKLAELNSTATSGDYVSRRPENISEADINNYVAEINRLIDRQKGALGTAGVELLTSTEEYDDGNEERKAEYLNIWNNLSPEGKQAIQDIVNRISASRFKNVYPNARGIRGWLINGNGRD